jgi:hypothetical protein
VLKRVEPNENITMPAQQSSTNSLIPQYWGQLALLFPIATYIASSHIMFEKQAAQIIASQTPYTSGIGNIIGFFILFGCCYALYSGLAKNSIVANWINMLLALPLVVLIPLGMLSGWGTVIALGWAFFAILGLHFSYKAKSA